MHETDSIERPIYHFGALYFTHMTQGILVTLPYVLGVYMVRDFLTIGDVPANEGRVGQMTGFLGACFCGAQLLTSYPIGIASDYIGRKPVIVVGNIVCVAGTIAFGLSGNFWQAVTTRLAAGFFNGIIGAVKAVIGESLSTESQAKAMGYISLNWGIGTLIGPVIGGFLVRPCLPGSGLFINNDWICSPNSLFTNRPYLLPCLAAASFSILATLLTAIFLEETLPIKRRPTYSRVGQDEEVELARIDQVEGGTKVNRNLHVEDSAEALESVPSKDLKAFQAGLSSALDDVPWYNQRPVLLALAGYALTAFLYILIDELIPIFASAPIEKGGLGLTPSRLAWPMSFGGAVLVVYALWGFPWLHKRYGTVLCCRIGLVMSAPMALLVPTCSLSFLPSVGTLWVAMAAKSIAGSNAFTSCLILVNQRAPKGSLGAVNGAGQTLASAVRAGGPALGGIFWAASLALFGNVWGHQFLPFVFAAAVALGTLIVYAL